MRGRVEKMEAQVTTYEKVCFHYVEPKNAYQGAMGLMDTSK